jgi:hypothetical protein
MSTLKLNIPHSLSEEEALDRIKKLLGNLKEEQKDKISNVKESWHDNKGAFSFTAKGFDLSGHIQVNASDIQISSRLPFAVSLFKNQISNLIQEKAKELLA